MDATRDMKKEYERIALETKGPQMFKPVDIPPSFEGFFRMNVTDEKKDDQETFFIPPPKYARASRFPFYRGCCLAYPYEENVKNQKTRKNPTLRFLKDSWQEDLQCTAREAMQDVKDVACMRLGGDLPMLETEAQEWIEELSSKSKRLKCKMVCHRLILNVARDLSMFTWCKVLLSCIADAVEGVQHAYKAGILHRNLSAGNIMIVKDKETQESRGILIDWDMCLLWRKHGGEPRSGRTGTWAFISVQILKNEDLIVTHTLWDDIESAFWVFIHGALLYLKHDKDPRLLYDEMEAIFSVVGGDSKMGVFAFCTLDQSHFGITQFEKPGVNKLLDQLGKVFIERYPKSTKTPFNLDDPDETWFSERLREAAMKMEPLCITPTGLIF
ncbi:hypothetical protein BYT27DRAFT_7197678 [Phlegmacium glaucopus]|nr:hypothetical protein BYT27DRAFT_7197678 [Phlegmacium glaucopus]